MVSTAFSVFESLVDRRIEEAIARGDLDDLPGAGRPLDLDEPPLVPPEVRMANRILKNAGYLPPEIDLQREISALERRGADAGSAADRKARARLMYLRLKLALAGGGRQSRFTLDQYAVRVAERLGGGR